MAFQDEFAGRSFKGVTGQKLIDAGLPEEKIRTFFNRVDAYENSQRPQLREPFSPAPDNTYGARLLDRNLNIDQANANMNAARQASMSAPASAPQSSPTPGMDPKGGVPGLEPPGGVKGKGVGAGLQTMGQLLMRPQQPAPNYLGALSVGQPSSSSRSIDEMQAKNVMPNMGSASPTGIASRNMMLVNALRERYRM